MAVEIVLEIGKEIATFEEFVQLYGPNAIAIDGFVKEGPKVDLRNRCFNYNHHDGVSRDNTYATCGQALTAVRYKVLDWFPRDTEGKHTFKIYEDDTDQDTILTEMIFEESELFISTYNPLVNALVDVENRLDASLGTYPYNLDMTLLRKIAWIFQPYDLFLSSGGKDRRNPEEYRCVSSDVKNRIRQYLLGRAGELPVRSNFDPVREEVVNGRTVAEIIPRGPLAKMAAAIKGIDVGLTFRTRSDGRLNVTGWRSTPYVPCRPEYLCTYFNSIEKGTLGTWGGGDMIFASPRDLGTGISKDDIWDAVIDDVKYMTTW